MKVYVVTAETDEWSEVRGVFSSVRAADEYIAGGAAYVDFEIWESWVDEDRPPVLHTHPTPLIDEALGVG